jgi:crossover junction endodeoxyribonuclease RusA
MTREWRLPLPYTAPPLSLNGRDHWTKRHRLTRQVIDDVTLLIHAHKVPALDEATIWLEWTPAVRRQRDTDNLEPTRKAGIDAIVRAGRLPNDTPEYVRRPENRILPVGKPSLFLVIRDGFDAERVPWNGCE